MKKVSPKLFILMFALGLTACAKPSLRNVDRDAEEKVINTPESLEKIAEIKNAKK